MSCELSVAYKVFVLTFEVRLETDVFVVPLYTDNTVVLLQSSDAAMRSGFAFSRTIWYMRLSSLK